MDFWPQNQQAEDPFEKLCSHHKWPSAWLDPSEPGVVGPFLAAQGGSWAINRGWLVQWRRWGWGERFWSQGILGAFALGGFSFPCPSLTFKGHCNSIFWARDSELRVSHRMNLNQVKKKMWPGKHSLFLSFWMLLASPRNSQSFWETLGILKCGWRLAPTGHVRFKFLPRVWKSWLVSACPSRKLN